MMGYGNAIRLKATFAEANERVRAALQEQGFGVLTEIDVQATLRNKLGEQIEDYVILGACNPQLAYQALGVDRQIGLLLPCNVVVRSDGAQTVVEMLDRVVPVEDKDVSTFLEKALTKQGMTIMTGAGVEDIKATGNGVSAKIKGKDGKVDVSDFSHVIVAIGIVPNTESIGIEKLAEMDRGFIKIDDYGRTKSKGLWAIGDCVPGPWLAQLRQSHPPPLNVVSDPDLQPGS